ncbi:uncharacterized protein PG986_002372 [Apiospora aurea]|uniref:Methyltransferase n=1 Tax=Apiospora aurea TaxID=335848 RepID=A0ABR1QZI5_9PEZI
MPPDFVNIKDIVNFFTASRGDDRVTTAEVQIPAAVPFEGATVAKEVKSHDVDAVLRGPVQRVHIDQSYRASLSRVPHHLPPDEAESLLRGRVQIINFWRPIATVQRDPLAVAEAASVAESDLVPIGRYPARRGDTLAVVYNPQHRWYYKHALMPEEVLLIKCFDTKTDGRARRVPHTAFSDPDADPGVSARESIEVRCLVFHPEDQS